MTVETTPTQQGGETPQFTPAYSGRSQAMAEIAKKAQEAIAGELNDFDETTGEIGAAHKPEPESAQEEAQPEPEAKAEPEAKPEPPPVKMVSIVVDGRAVEVPEDRIIEAGKRTLQKESAADRRLQDAADKERRAQAMLERAERLSNPDAATHQQAPSQDAQQPTHQATQGLNPEALDQFFEQKLYMRDAQKAAVKFEKDFPEIASDPHLRSIAAGIEQQRLDTAAALGEPFGDPFEAYQQAGEKVRDWLKQRAPKEPTAVASLADKADKKRSIVAPSAASATATKPQEKKPLSIAEQIDVMREARLKGRPLPINRSL